MRIVNTTAEPQKLSSGTCLGSLQPINVLQPVQEQASALSDRADVLAADDVKSALTEKLPSDLTDSQRQQVHELLSRYNDVFSRGAYDMGRTSLVEHTIDTVSASVQ